MQLWSANRSPILHICKSDKSFEDCCIIQRNWGILSQLSPTNHWTGLLDWHIFCFYTFLSCCFGTFWVLRLFLQHILSFKIAGFLQVNGLYKIFSKMNVGSQNIISIVFQHIRILKHWYLYLFLIMNGQSGF